MTPAAKRPRTQRAEVRREQLMNAAQALFLNHGFADTSVDEIVGAAQAAKGTFYLYFKTKEDVLHALRERFIERFHQRLERAVARRPGEDWTGRLDAWIEAAVNGYLDDLALHDLVFHEFRPSVRHAEQDNPIAPQLTALLADGAKADAWTVRDARLTAVMLFSAFHGAVDDHISAPDKMSRRRLIGELRDFCRRALGLS